jgi:hypothetical protein
LSRTRSASSAATSTTSLPTFASSPFCSFNVIPEWYRDRIQQKFGMPIEAWEAKKGRKLEDGLYRGTLRRGGHAAGCGCAAGEGGEEVHIQPITGTDSYSFAPR